MRFSATKIKQVIYKIIGWILNEIFVFTPITISFYAGFLFLQSLFKENVKPEQYTIILTAIGIAATLSGLSFRASSSCKYDGKKAVYYKQGERLLHSTLLFIFTLILINAANSQLIAFNYVKSLCLILGGFCFTLGLAGTYYAVSILNKILFNSNLYP